MTTFRDPAKLEYINATIDAGGSVSGAVDTGTMTLLGIFMPSTWTAAGLSFQASVNGTTYVPVYTGSGEYRIAAANVGTNRYIALTADNFNGLQLIKIVSAEGGAAVNQVAARTLTLVFKQL